MTDANEQSISLTEQEATERVRNFASKLDMCRHKLDGWSVWRLFTFPIAMELMNLPFASAVKGNRLMNHIGMWPEIVKDFPAFLFTRRARYVALTYSSALVEPDSDGYKDIYFDDLLLQIGSYFKIEKYVNHSFAERSSKARIIRDTSGMTADYIAGLISRFTGPRKADLLASEMSLDITGGELGSKIFSEKVLKRCLRSYFWRKTLYKLLLKRISPEYVFVADTGEFALMAAAKELGIKFVEFQHGIMSRHHPHVLTEYERQYRDSAFVPDMLLLYGQHWKAELESQGFYTGELQVVGNIRIDRYREYRREFRAARDPKAPVRVLLTTQGLDTDRIVMFLKEFIRCAGRDTDFILNIKLHPMRETSKEAYEDAFSGEPRVRVLLGSEDPATFSLLAESDLHVSIASACHYDALGLGVPTVILPFSGHDMAINLHSSGHAWMANTPEELLEMVRACRDTGVPEEISSYYYEPGAMNNIKKALGIAI